MPVQPSPSPPHALPTPHCPPGAVQSPPLCTSHSTPLANLFPCSYLPVCGADNQTYGNNCMATAAGVEVAHEGECTGPTPLPIAKDDNSSSRPIACPALYAPVCSRSGATYDNSCVAQGSGDIVACQGACPCPDLLSALQSQGGILFVPVDATLLPLLDNLTASFGGDDWTQDTDTLLAVLGAHLVLGQPVASNAITTVTNDTVTVTYAPAPGPAADTVGQLVNGTTLYTQSSGAVAVASQRGANGSQSWRVTPLAPQALAPVQVLDVRNGCSFTVALLADPLIDV